VSAEAETHVLRLCEVREELRPIHCHVLQLLSIRHDRDYRIAWPSVEGMARESHYSTRAIYKALDELTGMGILHRDYGELPRKSRRDRVKLGNRYRFPGLDEIPEDEHPRLLGGRKATTSDAADEPRSPEPDDVHMNGQMNLTQAPDEPDDALQMNRADEPDTHVTGNTEPAGENWQMEPAVGMRASARGQPCPKPIPRRTRYDQVLDLIRAAEPGLVVGGSRMKNEQPVNDSPAPVETIAAAYVDLMHGRWPDPFVQKLGSLQAVVENLGGYVYGVENGFGSLERQNGRVKPTSVPARHVVDRTGIRN
jgi:hypothetical protein